MAGEQDKDEPINSSAFETLLAEHQKQIYFFIRSMIFNSDDARDVLQDVNIIMVRKRQKFVAGSNFKAWAFQIARFEGLAYLARHKRVQWCTLDSGLIETIADAAEEKAEEVTPQAKALEHCKSILPDESRDLLEHRYKKRTPLDQLANAWKTTEGALKQKLFRIRARLKKCILEKLSPTTP